MTTNTNLPSPNTDCSLCGLPAPYCPCDRHDLFTTPNQPLYVQRFTVTDDGHLIPMEEAETTPTVDVLSTPERKPTLDAASSPRNIGLDHEPEEYELNRYFEC
jgi:hypothetical protein